MVKLKKSPTEKRTIQKYLIFVIFCVKKINAGDLNVSTFKLHLKTVLQVTAIPLTSESINSK